MNTQPDSTRTLLVFLLLLLSSSSAFSQPTGLLVKLEGTGVGLRSKQFQAPWREVLPSSELRSMEAEAAGVGEWRAAQPYRWIVNSLMGPRLNARRSQSKAWDMAYDTILNPQAYGLNGVVLAAEPDLKQLHRHWRTPRERSPQNQSSLGAVLATGGWAKAWPNGGTSNWHLDSSRTELGDAVQASQSPDFPTNTVRIAIVDTEFDSFNPSLEQITYAPGDPLSVKNPSGTFARKGHGTGTLAILAGQPLTVYRTIPPNHPTEIFHGANPRAEILRIGGATGVAHLFSTSAFIEGLDLAMRHHADIVSVSMGGLPSGALRDATNRAYLNGLAIFAAAGNYFKLPLLPISTPKFMVYPAAYRSVVGVTGITAADRSYFYPHTNWGWLRDFRHWIMRGNAGPWWSMRRAVAAYTPNIPWAQHGETAWISLQGGGTSSATPQAAGAAALWLQKHRVEVERLTTGASWKKAELIMQASMKNGQYPPNGKSEWTNLSLLGKGVIKANSMLSKPPNPAWLPEKPMIAKAGTHWINIIAGIAFPAPTAEFNGLNRAQQEIQYIDSLAQLVSSQRLKLEPAECVESSRKLQLLEAALLTEAQQQLFCSRYWDQITASVFDHPDDRTQQLTRRMARAALRELQKKDCSELLQQSVRAYRNALNSPTG